MAGRRARESGIGRRRLVAAAASLPVLAASRGRAAPAAAIPVRGPVPAPGPARVDGSLAAIAATRGLRFGSEILASEIPPGAPFAGFFARECDILVPGFEAKWDHVEPAPGLYDFAPLDRIVDFAASRGIAVRMHTLLWGLAMPPWLRAMLGDADAAEATALLERHVDAVAGRYRGRIYSWDVGNELSDPLWHRGPEGLTLTPWRRALGPGCVDIAFRLTRRADPAARLFLNEDGLEWQGTRFDAKRATYLRLIEGWKRAGVPIDGFGLQTHLSDAEPFDARAYRRFLAELAGFGLELHLTELDVHDRDLPAEFAGRDAACADLVARVLDVALEERAVSALLTWGLSDRDSYQDHDPEFARPDGLPSRGLPFDAALRPKPMRDAIARALAAAPVRPMPADIRAARAVPAQASDRQAADKEDPT